MFDHVVFGVSDYAASKAFYLAALAPLGIRLVAENALGVEMCSDDECSLCLFPTHEKNPRICIWPSGRTRARKWMPFTTPPSPPAALIMARLGCALITVPTITQPLSLRRTDIMWRWSAIRRKGDPLHKHGVRIGPRTPSEWR